MFSGESNKSIAKKKKRYQHKSRGKKAASKCLYAVAKGKGGSISIGLYRQPFDKISFLVEGRIKGKYRRVQTEEEGMDYINEYYKSKGKHRPKWNKQLCPHYPSLNRVRRHMGLYIISSSGSESMIDSDLSVDTFSSQDRTRRSQKRGGYNTDSTASAGRPSNTNDHVGSDPSLGRDNELFNVNIKNINGLEDGLRSSGIGKTTRCLLLGQMEDMTAYPHHSSTIAAEGIGELVEAVTGFSWFK